VPIKPDPLVAKVLVFCAFAALGAIAFMRLP
jgi:hypothetical protein